MQGEAPMGETVLVALVFLIVICLLMILRKMDKWHDRNTKEKREEDEERKQIISRQQDLEDRIQKFEAIYNQLIH